MSRSLVTSQAQPDNWRMEPAPPAPPSDPLVADLQARYEALQRAHAHLLGENEYLRIELDKARVEASVGGPVS